MSATENSEFAVPEVVAENEKEESKEIKATKRPAEVSTTRFFSHIQFNLQSIFICSKKEIIVKKNGEKNFRSLP